MTDVKTPARATIVVTQRERMSAAQEALEAIYANTSAPFELTYVVGKVSGRRRRWLQNEAACRGFRFVEAGRPLTPAEARNLGAAEAKTDFILFIENDVIPSPGWLSALIACADETGADGVVPMTCEGRPLHTIVHHIGAESENRPGADGVSSGHRDYNETFHLQGLERGAAGLEISRRQTATCEMHCLLVRRSAIEAVDGFDPLIVSKEHLDFSWRFAQKRLRLWLEPNAVVTFLVPSEDDPIRLSDLPYFLLRWSAAWQRQSHDALKRKWGLQEAGYVASRRRLSGWRIMDHLVKPAVKAIPVLGQRWGFVERGSKLLYPFAASAADLLASRYRRLRKQTVGAVSETADA